MDSKKQTIDENYSVDPEESPELIQHVDEMMDPKLPDPVQGFDASSGTSTGQAIKATGAPDLPEIDIFKDAAPVEDSLGDNASDTKPKKKSKKKTEAGMDSDSDGMVDETDVADDRTNREFPPVEENPNDLIITDGTLSDEEIPVDTSVNEEAADPLVDEIIAKESDQLLELRTDDLPAADVPDKEPFSERLKEFFKLFLKSKWTRNGAFVLLFLGLVAAGIVPDSRYYVLNTAGVRSSTSLTVLDSTNDLPLKNVAVTIGEKSGTTNADGVVRLEELKLGDQTLTVQQLGFAKVTRIVTLGLGSNPLGELELRAIGTQYTFKLTDYLTGKPVKNAEITNDDATAQSDDKGIVILTLGQINGPKIDVTISAGGYRTEKTSISALTAEATKIIMVTKRKEVFVSKQSGKFDVYKIDVDGKNKQLLLAGTGNERDQITLVPHATDEMVALVSSREDKRNQDGYLLDALTLINVSTGTATVIEHSERISIVDWMDDKLVYVKIKAGTSAGNPDRQQLMSYNYSRTLRMQLASANNFSDIVSAKGSLYYAASNNYPGGQSHFSKVSPDNSGKQTLLSKDIWNIIRSDFASLYLAGSNEWFSYTIGDKEVKKLDKNPANTTESRFYLDAPDGKHALWTESRDGKGVLLTYDEATRKDKTLATQSGLSYPLRWLDARTVIYRVANSQETASYAISLDGGDPKRITDVTNTSGLGRWYFGYY